MRRTVRLLLVLTVTSWACAVDPDVQRELDNLKTLVNKLTKQTMIQQEFIEERVRTDGQSGIKQVRHDTEGTKNYYGSTHIDYSMAGIHDHSDFDRILGMGEVSAVINGVEFRTRHLDYRIVQASTKSKQYGAVEDIPYPEVPPEVTNKATPQAQIAEMKEWFKAFAKQDRSVRDYTKYFKPVLCYMEGMWTKDDLSEITEPFFSDRHRLDATSWDNLMDKARYMAYTGTKDNYENVAFHPRKIMSIDATTGEPIYGQWNYRILCHPIGFDIPIKYLKQREDWSWSYPRFWNLSNALKSRGARFELSELDNDDFSNYTLLDKIMQSIPGVDNVPADSLEEGYGGKLWSAEAPGTKVPLKAGYYHRWFKFSKIGAMGTRWAHRSYSDQYLFVSVNTQDNIVPMSFKQCRSGVCNDFSARVTYAIPMEIVYLTPLLKWNPYNIAFNDDLTTTSSNGRDGYTAASAYLGADAHTFYRTPVSLFSGGAVEADLADSIRPIVKMKNVKGNVVDVTATGTRCILPKIEGAGEVRLRYPIHPIHGEGSAVWKEVNVIRDWLTSDESTDYSDADYDY